MTVMAQPKQQTHFNEILTRVSFYIIRLAVISVLALLFWSVGAALAFAYTFHSAWIIGAFFVVAILGILSAQYGFIAHEASHRQIFHNNKANDSMGLILANLFAGLSYGFWLRKHNKHHQRPLAQQSTGLPLSILVAVYRI
jgi:fatty acid desaturase